MQLGGRPARLFPDQEGRRLVLVSVASRTGAPVRGLRVVVAAALAITVALAGVVIAARGAHADSSSSLVSMTNGERAAHGLPPLAVSGDLAAAARAQAARMAASRTLAHTPNLPGAVCCWSALGENVGEGPSAASIEGAFMASPDHRANILSSAYTQVGIGVVVDAAGTLWVSEIFRRPSGAAAPPPPAAPQPVAPRPAPATSTPAQHRPATANQPAAVPTRAAQPPAAAQTRASRDLARVSLEAAQRLAKQLDDAPGVQGSDPVAKVLDFVAMNATLG